MKTEKIGRRGVDSPIQWWGEKSQQSGRGWGGLSERRFRKRKKGRAGRGSNQWLGGGWLGEERFLSLGRNGEPKPQKESKRARRGGKLTDLYRTAEKRQREVVRDRKAEKGVREGARKK